MQWPEPLRRLPEPWPTFFESSYLVGPTAEGMCLLLVDDDVVQLATSLYVSLKLLRATRLTHPGATGVVVVPKQRYQGLVNRTVELVGVRNANTSGHKWNQAESSLLSES